MKAESARTPSGARSAAERRSCGYCGVLHHAIIEMKRNIMRRPEAETMKFMEALRHGEADLDAINIMSCGGRPRSASRQGE
jgi:hypothetical protein